MRKRLLIISHDVVGRRMAGPGIRYWELARALAPQLDVTLVATAPIDLEAGGLGLGSYAWGDAASLAPWLAGADLVLANAYALAAHPELADCPAPLLLDLYDPTLLENLEQFRDRPAEERAERARADVELLRRQLAAGDAFLCATERQRDLYIGALMHAGRVTPEQVAADPLLRGLIAVVPFGLPAEPPARTGPALRGVIPGVGPDDPLILWTGGLWDWMDPQSLVRAMPAVVAAAPRARLVFLAGRHPGLGLLPRAAEESRAIAAELGLLDRHVFFYGEWVPYARRADFLLDADVVVSLHRQHLETAYAAVRSRFLDHLWAGLPSLVGDGDSAADLVRAGGVGLVAPIGDSDAIAAALVRIIADDALRAEQGRRARALGEQYAWPKLIAPILAFAAAPPRRAAAATTQPMSTPAETTTGPTNAALLERGELLNATRNAAIQAQERTWNIAAPALPGGLLGRVRRFLVDQIVRPFVQPLIDSQRDQNAAVLRSSYALAEQLDHQRAALQAAQAHLSQLAAQVEQMGLTLRQAQDHLALRATNIEQGMTQMNHWQVTQLHQTGQQIRDFADQLAGLEETSAQILARLGGVPAAPPSSRSEAA